MNVYAISALVNVVTSVVLGSLVLFTNWRNQVNRLFALFTLAIAVWGYAYFSWQIATTSIDALFWIHILMVGAILIPFFYFHFIARFLGLQKRLRWPVWMGYFIAICFIVVNWSSLFISRIEQQGEFPFWPIAGPLFLPFLSVWILYAAYAAWLLFKRLRITNNKEERAQIRYILIGTAIGYIGGCTNYFLWYGISVSPYGNITAAIYIILIAYAILKHGLFATKVVATEFIVFALWLFVFVRMLLAKSATEQFINGGLLFVLLIVGVLLIRSVDREVEQRERIQKLAEELEETNERQEGLIHFLGHEVKGFLTTDAGTFAALAEGDVGELPEAMRPFVNQALAQTRENVVAVTDILKASNQKKGLIEYKKEPFDFKELAAQETERARPLARTKGLELSFTAEEASGPYTVLGDRREIGDHVLRNLIDNAVNYTPTGSVAISLKKADGKIIFAVKDTGVGITEEDQKRLFTEGGHGKDSQRVNAHSTGYGLYIAKNITAAHGGTLRAESAGAGKGSTFTAEFPAA